MKVTVTKYLNVRVGKPSVNVPCYQYLAPGSEIEVDGKLYPGDKYDGIDTWMRDEANNYYWSGGVKAPEPKIEKADIGDWIKRFEIDQLWPAIDLKDTTVAILDSGINVLHVDLKGAINKSENFMWPGDNCNDDDGHGSHCAGIIAGQGIGRVYGVAKGVKLNVAEVVGVRGMGINEKVLYNAIKWAISESDVISMSLGIPYDSDSIHDLIIEASNSKKIFIAAIGNIEVGKENKGDYPARYDEVISVGALDSNFEISDFTIRNSKIDINVPGENIVSCFAGAKDAYQEESGTSMATAFVAGLAAIYKTKNPMSDFMDFKSFLNSISETKKDGQFVYSSIKPQSILI